MEALADGSTSLNRCLLIETEARLRIKKTWAGQLLTRLYHLLIPLGLMAVFLGKGETWGMQTD